MIFLHPWFSIRCYNSVGLEFVVSLNSTPPEFFVGSHKHKKIAYFFISTRKMSGEDAVVAVEPVSTAGAEIPNEPMDIVTPFQLLLRKSLAYGGIARDLHEGAKVIRLLLCGDQGFWGGT
ncbi:hypothetical protein MtrunA17_Chr4g0037191 [Medicago truncatula]|uniref:Uncharacterized protein n=1 Tax=Medicago truncatula TaxID=3880 RepID=A0A396IFA0_MEDTR|nr:hypothetical protein MtrunA17_Chr4g0037191 [Medicago truncatula]